MRLLQLFGFLYFMYLLNEDRIPLRLLADDYLIQNKKTVIGYYNSIRES